jgi:Mg2+/citrate symporter
MKKSLTILIGFLAISLISHFSYVLFDYLFNANVIFFIAIVITLYIAYKGIKEDLKTKDTHNNNHNNAY